MQKQIEELERQNAALLKEVKHKEDLLEHYQQQFRLLQKKMFGSSSEKSIVMSEQLSLFNEAEITACVWQDKNLPEWKLRNIPPPKANRYCIFEC
ncbi:MAG: transposase domain-containing protein [Saccharofermentanales bacterium]